jgi:mannosylglycoprotein endo-beta-mannosidase
MSYNFLGGNGDGPYGIQPIETFWQHRTWPFNSEVGSVGVGDIESLKRFIPDDHLVAPTFNDKAVDPVWDYHKYIGYGEHMRPYGDAKDATDFGRKAQLINYNQYRALMEGFSAHMWEWYTGSIIWKTQNPWTAMRGQMYDYYLDPNACLYGLRKGSEPLHIMYNPVDGMVMVVNNHFETYRDLMLRVETIDMEGKVTRFTQVFAEIGPTTTKKYLSVKSLLDQTAAKDGIFLKLSLMKTDKEAVAENFYWVPNATGTYTGLNTLKPAALTATAKKVSPGQITVTLTNPASSPVAFFNRVSLTDQTTGKRTLPAFYDNNYISLLPGETQTVTIDLNPTRLPAKPEITIEGWNVTTVKIPVTGK